MANSARLFDFDSAPRVDRHLFGCTAIASLAMFAPAADSDVVSKIFGTPITITAGYGLLLDFGATEAEMKYKLTMTDVAVLTSYEFGIEHYYAYPYTYNTAEIQTAGSFTVELLSAYKFGPPKKFVVGESIDAKSSSTTFSTTTYFFDPYYGGTYGSWVGGGYGFLGTIFTKTVGPSTYKYYGWIALYIGVAGAPAKVYGFAWEDIAGAPITAGAVPEPGAGALAGLALGAIGISAWRRRRREAAEATA